MATLPFIYACSRVRVSGRPQRLLAGVLDGEQGRDLLTGVRPHRAELVHAERLPVQADALLALEKRTGAPTLSATMCFKMGSEPLSASRFHTFVTPRFVPRPGEG